jgi:hypothetical protein
MCSGTGKCTVRTVLSVVLLELCVEYCTLRWRDSAVPSQDRMDDVHVHPMSSSSESQCFLWILIRAGPSI